MTLKCSLKVRSHKAIVKKYLIINWQEMNAGTLTDENFDIFIII